MKSVTITSRTCTSGIQPEVDIDIKLKSAKLLDFNLNFLRAIF